MCRCRGRSTGWCMCKCGQRVGEVLQATTQGSAGVSIRELPAHSDRGEVERGAEEGGEQTPLHTHGIPRGDLVTARHHTPSTHPLTYTHTYLSMHTYTTRRNITLHCLLQNHFCFLFHYLFYFRFHMYHLFHNLIDMAVTDVDVDITCVCRCMCRCRCGCKCVVIVLE